MGDKLSGQGTTGSGDFWLPGFAKGLLESVSMRKLIGILFHSFDGPLPYDLERTINRIAGKKIKAEMVKIGHIELNEPCPYSVIIDRASHIIQFYREYLKHAKLSGCRVINNPFCLPYQKFAGYEIVSELGIFVPRTVMLPSKAYPDFIGKEDLTNLKYPLDWKKAVDYTGFPSVLKPVDGGGWKHVYLVNNFEELMRAYDKSGMKVMLLQQYIEYDLYIRAIVIGKKHCKPIRYNPDHKKFPELPAYIIDQDFLDTRLFDTIVKNSIKICQTLDLDMNSVEWAIKDGKPYAIDFTNPIPDANPRSITPRYYEWTVEKLSSIAIEYAGDENIRVENYDAG